MNKSLKKPFAFLWTSLCFRGNFLEQPSKTLLFFQDRDFLFTGCLVPDFSKCWRHAYVLGRFVFCVQYRVLNSLCSKVVSTAWLNLLTVGRSLSCVDCCCRVLWGCAEGMFCNLCMICPGSNRRMRFHSFLTLLANRRWWGTVTCSKGKVTLCYSLLGNIRLARIWEQSKKAACFPEEKERAEKVVGWGTVYEMRSLSATFTSWLMLGIGVLTQTA